MRHPHTYIPTTTARPNVMGSLNTANSRPLRKSAENFAFGNSTANSSDVINAINAITPIAHARAIAYTPQLTCASKRASYDSTNSSIPDAALNANERFHSFA